MRTVAAGVVLLVAAVSGCSSGDAPPAEVAPLASGTRTASPSTTGGVTKSPAAAPGGGASSSAVPVEQPTASFPATVDGASAFARDYVRLIGLGFAEASSDAVRKRSAPGCEGCEALMGAMDQAASEGLRQRGGEYEVSSLAASPLSGSDVIILLTYTRTASEIVNVEGDVVDRAPAVPMTTVQLRLIHGSGGWRVQGYRLAD